MKKRIKRNVKQAEAKKKYSLCNLKNPKYFGSERIVHNWENKVFASYIDDHVAASFRVVRPFLNYFKICTLLALYLSRDKKQLSFNYNCDKLESQRCLCESRTCYKTIQHKYLQGFWLKTILGTLNLAVSPLLPPLGIEKHNSNQYALYRCWIHVNFTGNI